MLKSIGVSLLFLLAGCSGEDADSVFVTATWSFRNVAVNQPLPCPEGLTATLHVRSVNDAACDASGATLCTTFLTCSAGTGTSDPLVRGTYEVWLEIGNPDGSPYATTPPAELDLSSTDKTYARQVVIDGGVFKAAWNLVDGAGNTVSCDAAGVTGVVVSASDEADPSTSMADTIDCDDRAGYTFAYAVSSYTVSLEAVNANGQTRGLAEPVTGKLITAPNGVTDLGTIDILVSTP